MSKSGFTKTVLGLVQERLVSLGFRKRKYGIFVLPVAEDVIGLVGLNTAHGRGPGILEINPIVGVRNQHLERLVAELLEKPFDEVNPYAAGANVGYLSPQSKYWPFIFTETAPVEGLADQLVDAIRMHGLPFIESNIPLPKLLETMRSNRLAIQIIAVYRVPVALYLLGQYAEMNLYLDNELIKIRDRNDLAAEQFRVFASRLKERNHVPALY